MGSIDDFSQLCRLCLVKDQVNQSIFDESSHIGQISVKINSCLPVQVSPDDDLPKKICDGCSYKLETLYIFRNTSVESEKQLKSWLSRSQSKDHSPDVKPEETITVKEETLDSSETADLNNYLIPYEQGIEFVATTESSEPPSKRARLAPTLKHLPLEETFGSDVDNDLDLIMPVLKTEEEDSDYGNQQDFVEVPSTSAEGQTSHPGVANAAVEAPSAANITHVKDDPLDVLKCDITGCKYEYVVVQGSEAIRCRQCRKSHSITIRRVLGKRKGKDNWKSYFTCPICNKELTRTTFFRSHLPKMHQVALMHPCNFCGQVFTGKMVLFKHVKECHQEVKTLCVFCGKNFPARSSLLLHKKTTHRDLEEVLQVSRKFAQDAPRKDSQSCDVGCKYQYIFDKTEEKLVCERCGKCLAIINRKIRYNYKGKQVWKYSFTCPICGKEIADRNPLYYHFEAVHHIIARFSCNFCDEKFVTKRLLVQHRGTRHKENETLCEICGMKFTQTVNYVEHMRTQHPKDEEPLFLKCDLCEKKFSSGSAVRRHVRVIHEGKRRRCELCGREFFSLASLRYHMRTHTGEKPYACKCCDKRCVSLENLKAHERVHTKEKPFVCELCGNRYSQGGPLRLHLRTVHSGENPYECSTCLMKFPSKSALNSHIRDHIE